jgi:hypothetical protein
MIDRRVIAGEAQEDQFTGMLESVTGKIPSSAFFGRSTGFYPRFYRLQDGGEEA